MAELGMIYTKGNSFRARAEARQREYRANVLKVKPRKYGHFLDEGSALAGANFILPEIHKAVQIRREAGKGVAFRTSDNMLSSQAMGFNVFTPLANRHKLAAKVLKEFFPSLESVKSISIEHTPDKSIFRDQSGHGGVDCDVLVRGTDHQGRGMVIVIEIKFVEPKFSGCGFRKPGRSKQKLDVCPDEVPVFHDRENCLYVHNKGYRYWEWSDQLSVLSDRAIPESGCPFGAGHWQLWVNYVLAHAEADNLYAKQAFFGVCAPRKNDRLLKNGQVMESFRELVREPERVVFLDVDRMLAVLAKTIPPELSKWLDQLNHRYGGI